MFGLVLSGGLSTRMGRDKGNLMYAPSTLTQRERCVQLLTPFCEQVFVSCREEQRSSIASHLPLVVDSVSGVGPGVGILSAARQFPNHAWLVLACDFPKLESKDIAYLVDGRSTQHAATCLISDDGTLEPLFSIWEVPAIEALARDFKNGFMSPKKTLMTLDCMRIRPLSQERTKNVNSCEDQLVRNSSLTRLIQS